MLVRKFTTFVRLSCATLVIAAALLFFFPASSRAQCATCRMALQQKGEQAARAINLGILVLLVPPVAIFCSIFVVAFRGKKGEE